MAGRRAGVVTGAIVAIGLAGATAAAQTPLTEGPPVEADTEKDGRIFVDTAVTDVRVGPTATVVTLSPTQLSRCRSAQYVYERDRPRWLAETGRLMQAMAERATLRISFSCRDGYQSINALQFLTPPPTALRIAAAPRREDVQALLPPPPVSAAGALPLPVPQ